MSLIQAISDITLTEVICNFEKIDDFIENSHDNIVEISAGIRMDYLKSHTKDSYLYRAKISFLLNIEGQDNTDNRLVIISHIIDFQSSMDNLDSNDTDLQFRLFELTEPYIRHRFSELSAQTKLSRLSFPYRFWELSKG